MVRKNRGSMKRQSVRRQQNGARKTQRPLSSDGPESPRVVAVKREEFKYPEPSPTRSVASTVVVSFIFNFLLKSTSIFFITVISQDFILKVVVYMW